MNRPSPTARLPRSSTALAAFLIVSPALAMALGASPALAQVDKQACAAAYEEVQSSRQSGRLLDARERALFCAQTECPDVVKNDCASWLSEIDASIPTVTFQARDAAGRETTSVDVYYDGEILKEGLDGKSIRVDPGEHTFRYELAGSAPIEQVIVIREGEKNRMLDVSFAVGSSAPGEGSSSAELAPSDLGGEGGEVSPLGYVFAGVGLVGIGMFAAFAIAGTSEKSDLEAPVAEGGCKPNCTDEQVDSVRTKLIVGDVSLAVGVVSLGVAAYFFVSAALSADTAGSSPIYVGVEPRAGGGYGVLGGRF
jgi:hypothetical protein